MPELARKYEERYYYYGEQRRTCTAIPDRRPFGQNVVPVKKYKHTQHKRQRHAKADKDVFIARFLGIFLLLTIGIFILPSAFKNITGSMFTKSPYPKIKAEYRNIVFPTLNYINNNIFLNELSLNGTASKKKALMKELPVSSELTDLENSIKNIMPMYPAIHPAVFVWDYDSGNYADINGEEIFPAASIIKIPVLIQLFKSIETKQLSLYDSMELTDYYRAEGSGNLQFKAENSTYTIDYLARIMITDSDNSATNMLMSKLGSMTDVNQGLRDWGIKRTQVKTWLPDMQGTNYTTAKDLAKMLYNIENPKFLSDNSRTKIISYMSHVKNNRLIQAGLGSGASFIHKTGDIGKMLGDAGVVTTPNGKKYIVIIMANRPYNSPEGKDFIVKASEIIYNYMVVK
ncbi:MAG: serine hydrolase [Candidatus Gastranaerophilaceae bacterium]|nr:serine hydrolase [Candidatus Gastranaerophilaceae bacterium]